MIPARREWGIIYILLALVQWRIQKRRGVGGMGPCRFSGALVRAYHVRHQPGTLLGLERAIPKGPILAPKGSFLVSRYCIGANSILKSPFYTEKREISIICGTFSVSGGALELQGVLKLFLEQVLDPPLRSNPVSYISIRI